MKKIKVLRLSRLLASASVAFHSSVEGIIFLFTTINTTLGALLLDYKTSIQLQQLAGNRDLRLANTRSITENDKVRDTYLRRFFKYIADFLKSPDAAEKDAALIVSDAISRFRGLMDYEMNKQTVEMQNLVTVLRTQPVMQAVADLDLTILVDKIADANAIFQGEMDTRIMDESKKIKLNTIEQRKETERLYLQVVDKINAMAILMPSSETDNCIDQLNALIDQYDRVISGMRAGGSGNEKLPRKETPSNEEVEN